MNSVYVRVAIYAIAGVASAAGFGQFDVEAGTLTLDLEEIAVAASAALVVNGAIFAVWGTK